MLRFSCTADNVSGCRNQFRPDLPVEHAIVDGGVVGSVLLYICFSVYCVYFVVSCKFTYGLIFDEIVEVFNVNFSDRNTWKLHN